MTVRRWMLLNHDGKLRASTVPGTLGGHRGTRIYGRLDCRAALSAIARGGYVKQRVFFLDEASALAAGFRPCAVCLPQRYAIWKLQQQRVLRVSPQRQLHPLATAVRPPDD